VKIVVKIGGAALEDKPILQKCAKAVVQLAEDGHQVAVVHGGGSALTRTLKLLGKKSDFVHGLRVTDAETRDVALMVLAGIVNKSLVAAIAAAGGCFYAQYFLFVDAGIAYGSWISIAALLAPIVGGAGTVFGPLLGALVVKTLGEATKLVAGDAPGLDLVIYGCVLILIVAFAPSGIAGLLRGAFQRFAAVKSLRPGQPHG